MIGGVAIAHADLPCDIVLDEAEAIQTALDQAPDEALVVILPESVSRAIQLIEARNPIKATPQFAAVTALPVG